MCSRARHVTTSAHNRTIRLRCTLEFLWLPPLLFRLDLNVELLLGRDLDAAAVIAFMRHGSEEGQVLCIVVCNAWLDSNVSYKAIVFLSPNVQLKVIERTSTSYPW